MNRAALTAALIIICALSGFAQTSPARSLTPPNPYARDPKQPIDQAYTSRIREYTTAPSFTSPLVDYLPASNSVPTPQVVPINRLACSFRSITLQTTKICF